MKRLPKKYKIGDILYVEWNDAYSALTSWVAETHEQGKDSCFCFSVGRYCGKNKGGDIILAGSWDSPPDVGVNNVMGRPIAMITKIKLLQKGKKN